MKNDANIPSDLEMLAKKAALQKHYKKDLFSFTKNLLGYSEVTWKTHGEIILALEAPTKRKLIVVPRGCFKSTIGVVSYAMWKLINDPNERILIDSELFTNSSNFLREIKSHFESQSFSLVFGTEWAKSTVWNQTEIIVGTRTKQFKEASITCGGVGTVKVGQHYSIIIGDDYNSPQNSSTDEGRQKIIRHYKYNQSILDPHGTYVLIGTRYSEDDAIGFVIKNELGLKDRLPKTGLYK